MPRTSESGRGTENSRFRVRAQVSKPSSEPLSPDEPSPLVVPHTSVLSSKELYTKCCILRDATLTTRPPAGTHWSSRSLAKAQGVSDGTIRKIWRQHGLQPHRVGRFKLSTDPHFVEKLRDVVGLYVNPPAKAVVFCVDEKSGIQALDRTCPVLRGGYLDLFW